MESGSFSTVGGAAKDTYWLYNYLKRELRSTEIDVYGDLSSIGPGVRYVGKGDLFTRNYDVMLLNSIRDVMVAEQYFKRTGREPFTVFTDRADLVTHYTGSPLKRLVSIGAGLPVLSNPEPFEKLANSTRDRHSMKQLKGIRNFFSKSYELHLFKRMREWLDCYVAISATQMEMARPLFRGRDVKLVYLPRAPHPNFKRTKAQKRSQCAIYAGRLEETQKRLSFLINGIAKVVELDRGLSMSVLLKIVGDGPDAKMYKSMVESLGLSKNVEFLGFRADDELVGLYNASGFLVSTSSWEGVGRSMLEAMACGIPVLLNDRINAVLDLSPKELLVRSGRNGLIYRYGDLGDFATKFARLYTDAGLRRRMGDDALAFAKKFDFSRVVDGYRRIITREKKER